MEQKSLERALLLQVRETVITRMVEHRGAPKPGFTPSTGSWVEACRVVPGSVGEDEDVSLTSSQTQISLMPLARTMVIRCPCHLLAGQRSRRLASPRRSHGRRRVDSPPAC